MGWFNIDLDVPLATRCYVKTSSISLCGSAVEHPNKTSPIEISADVTITYQGPKLLLLVRHQLRQLVLSSLQFIRVVDEVSHHELIFSCLKEKLVN